MYIVVDWECCLAACRALPLCLPLPVIQSRFVAGGGDMWVHLHAPTLPDLLSCPALVMCPRLLLCLPVLFISSPALLLVVVTCGFTCMTPKLGQSWRSTRDTTALCTPSGEGWGDQALKIE